jgi:shikimate kinase
MHKFVILIGPPGSGKTVCGQALADKIGWEFLDTDSAIEQRTGLTVAEIFQEYGELNFRQLESCLLEELAVTPVKLGCVLSTGGGLPVTPGNLPRLKELGPVILLQAEFSTLVQRVIKTKHRPLLASQSPGTPDAHMVDKVAERLATLIKQRQEIYNQADYKVDTSVKSPQLVADELIKFASGIENR